MGSGAATEYGGFEGRSVDEPQESHADRGSWPWRGREAVGKGAARQNFLTARRDLTHACEVSPAPAPTSTPSPTLQAQFHQPQDCPSVPLILLASIKRAEVLHERVHMPARPTPETRRQLCAAARDEAQSNTNNPKLQGASFGQQMKSILGYVGELDDSAPPPPPAALQSRHKLNH